MYGSHRNDSRRYPGSSVDHRTPDFQLGHRVSGHHAHFNCSPQQALGRSSAGALHLKPDFLPFGLVSNLVPTLFYNTGATLVLVGVNVGFTAPYYWTAVAGDLVFMYIVSYVLSLIAERIGMLIAKRVFNEKDRQLDMRDLPHV